MRSASVGLTLTAASLSRLPSTLLMLLHAGANKEHKSKRGKRPVDVVPQFLAAAAASTSSRGSDKKRRKIDNQLQALEAFTFPQPAATN